MQQCGLKRVVQLQVRFGCISPPHFLIPQRLHDRSRIGPLLDATPDQFSFGFSHRHSLAKT